MNPNPIPTQQRVILYSRVAAAPQFEREPSRALDRQLAEMRQFAARRGWQIVGEFTDLGHSGLTLNRPGLTALRQAVTAGKTDIVLVYEFHRLSRSIKNACILFDEFLLSETGVISMKDFGFDFTDLVGRVSLLMVTALNQYYQDQTWDNRGAGSV